MTLLLVFGLLLLNLAISMWNAYAAGRIWREVSGFMKLVAWSALVMSACGFLEVLAIVLGFIAISMHWINQHGFDALLSLTYLLIIVPVLGAGLIITIHSWIEAYKRRDFGSIVVAGYNTAADAYNIYEAADGGISGAFKSVSESFSSDDEDDSVAQVVVLLILLVAMALASGLTIVFFQIGRSHAIRPPVLAAAQSGSA